MESKIAAGELSVRVRAAPLPFHYVGEGAGDGTLDADAGIESEELNWLVLRDRPGLVRLFDGCRMAKVTR